jgi:hypothetical protein
MYHKLLTWNNYILPMEYIYILLIFMDPCIIIWPSRITNKMQPWNRIYYFTVHWRLNMFQVAYRPSSGAPTLFAASGLLTHVVTGRSQVWVGTVPTQTWLQPVIHLYVVMILIINCNYLPTQHLLSDICNGDIKCFMCDRNLSCYYCLD